MQKRTLFVQIKILRLNMNMQSDIDTMTYMMAAEKMGNLIYTLEATIEFMEEYKVKPDEEVKKCLTPLVDRIRKWLDGK